MAAKRKEDRRHEVSQATTKLSRLLETENKLEEMLKEARREAKGLVEAAQMAADGRVRELESQLEGEEERLRQQIARERDRTIDSIRSEARQETKRLDELDDARIAALARHVVALLLGPPDSRGTR